MSCTSEILDLADLPSVISVSLVSCRAYPEECGKIALLDHYLVGDMEWCESVLPRIAFLARAESGFRTLVPDHDESLMVSQIVK